MVISETILDLVSFVWYVNIMVLNELHDSPCLFFR